MNGHKQLNLILALILLPSAIIFPTQSATLTAINPPPPETNPPEALQGIPGATMDWWAAVQEDLHLPGYLATGQMAVISGLSLVPDWEAVGEQEDAEFGYAVATAGDVNGDGYSDVIIGIIHYSNGQSQEGAAVVYHGSVSGLSLDHNWLVEGNNQFDQFGNSVGTAGDVNGDGYDDVIVGAPCYSHPEECEGGAVVYHGSASGLPLVPNWLVESNQAGARFGQSVGTAGDVNGDGYADVIVGAHTYTNGQNFEGAAAVYHGSASGLSLLPDWGDEGDQEGAHFGLSVGTAGDVNGDGYDDVIVGAPDYTNGQTKEGAAVVYHGSASGLLAFPNWGDEGDQEGAYFGYSVGTAGDVNGDGYADVIVGAPNWTHGQEDEGGAALYYGSASGLSVVPNWIVESNMPGAEFGISVSTASDVNGDGYADVIVGAHYYTNGQADEGGAVVYHGSVSGLSHTPNWGDESNQEGARFGWSVGTAGDVNGDGYADIIVGALFYDNSQIDEGAAFVYHGGEDLQYLYLPVVLSNP